MDTAITISGILGFSFGIIVMLIYYVFFEKNKHADLESAKETLLHEISSLSSEIKVLKVTNFQLQADKKNLKTDLEFVKMGKDAAEILIKDMKRSLNEMIEFLAKHPPMQLDKPEIKKITEEMTEDFENHKNEIK